MGQFHRRGTRGNNFHLFTTYLFFIPGIFTDIEIEMDETCKIYTLSLHRAVGKQQLITEINGIVLSDTVSQGPSLTISRGSKRFPVEEMPMLLGRKDKT